VRGFETQRTGSGREKEYAMAEKKLALRLNQQQRELLDRTVEEQGASSRAELIVRALREYHAEHFGR
jgi:metal-responsive CopG/Arc/MetJ family transcriptional regulator